MSDDLISVAWIGTGLILVVSALVARRMSGRAWVRMAAIWVAIIGLAWAAAWLAGHLNMPSNFT